MSTERDPFGAIQWPEPMLADNDRIRRRAIRAALPELDDDDLELVAAKSRKVHLPAKAAPGRTARIRDALKDAARDLIIRAEAVQSASGPERKRLVTDEVMHALEAIEERLDLMPGWVQRAVFWLVRRMVRRWVQKTFDWLHSEGLVNDGRALA